MTAPDDRTPMRWQRVGRRFVLLILLPGLALVAGLGWWATSGRYVTTNNAYVKAAIVAISADIDGRVVAVAVADDQAVERGDLLFRIDPDGLEIDKDQAAAHLLSVRHQIEGWRAAYHETEAAIDEAAARARYQRQQADRQRALERRGIAAVVRLEEAELALSAAQKQLVVLEQKRRAALARLGGEPDVAVDQHPAYREAVAAREKTVLQLKKTEVTAPIAGVVSRMRLQQGEWMEAGEPAFTIVDQTETWIEANLKETQLTHIEVGQRVAIAIDSFPDGEWSGRIASISAATGAEFALIPPQNASGNWVKVVQRLPVRIVIDPADHLPSLRAGMTASIAIDTERDSSLVTLVKAAMAGMLGRD